jgi:formylglycine-generating enzyme required for sulfatase activity/serine/threonine protein kinase
MQSGLAQSRAWRSLADVWSQAEPGTENRPAQQIYPSDYLAQRVTAMPIPTQLLQDLGWLVLARIDDQALSDVSVEADLALATAVWQAWAAKTTAEQRRAEIEALAAATRGEVGQAIRTLLEAVGNSRPADTIKALVAYLVLLPAAVRRRLRRPSNPDGTSLPPGLPLDGPADMLAMLPPQSSWFRPGDRTWDVGEFELVELVETGAYGEGWKAHPLRTPDAAPVLLKFCLHPEARATVLLREIGGAHTPQDRAARDVRHPGLVALRHLHLNTTPLCLEYEFFESGTLTSLIQEWQAAGTLPDANFVLGLLRQIIDPLAHLHRLQPPLAHGDLQPERILVQAVANGYQCKIADLGLRELLSRPASGDVRRRQQVPATPGPWPPALALAGTDPQLYLSPERRHGQSPGPCDDVYALGVLWYQLHLANLTIGRPGGMQWRKRLVERGLAEPLSELLASCFEDDPADRPADAGILADELTKRLARGQVPFPKRPALDPLAALAAVPPAAEPVEPLPVHEAGAAPRARARRADVWQLFDTLEKKAPERAKTFTNSVDMKLVLIPPGTFHMGTPEDEPGCRENEVPHHEVTLTRSFYLAVTPVTQQQFLRVMGHNPAHFHPDNGGSPEHPVENVNWESAVEFCRRLSALPEEKQAGRMYRLPTEAEWEYACRAGTDTPFCYGSALSSTQANFDGGFPFGDAAVGRFAQKTTRVGQQAANNFGLYDMHGNVWEWCADWLGSTYYKESPKRDPRGPEAGRYRVLRGGSWRNHATTCRAGYRNGLAPRLKDSATGFRVVLEVTGE